MTRVRHPFSRPTLSTVFVLSLAAGISCSTDGGDGSSDNGDGDGDTVTNTPDPGGDGDVAATGGVTGGDGDVAATGGVVDVIETGDGNGGGGNTPPGFASCASTASIQELGGAYTTEDNNGPDDHSSMYGANPRIVAAPRADGTFDVAWQTSVGDDTLYISHVSEDGGTYGVEWTLEVPSLGVVGGLAVDPSGDPVVVTASDERIAGDVEPEELHRPDIMAIVRLGDDCMEKYRQDLRTDYDGDSDRLPLYSPFTAGTSRLAIGGGTYVVHYSQNTEYDPGVTSRHQIGRYLIGSSETGAISSVPGNISHSFDQRLHFDGAGFVSLSLGDASLRGVALSYITAAGDKDQRTIFSIKGGDGNTGGGYNNTFTRLGDVRHAKSGFVSIFATEEEPTHPERVSFSRNIGLVHSPANFYDIEQPEKYEVTVADTGSGNDSTSSWEVDILDYWGNAATGKNEQIAWVTDYNDRASEHAERPKLVRWSEDRFFVIWEMWSLDDYQATYATIVDEWGNTIEPAATVPARLPRGDDAFLINGQAAWLEGTDGNIVLHMLDRDLTHTSQTL